MAVREALQFLGIGGKDMVILRDLAPEQTATHATPEPVKAAAPAVHSGMRLGDKGDDVAVLQKTLASLGYSVGSIDGIFGAKTEAAVLAFQKAKGLDEVGIVGPHTLRFLGLTNAEPTGVLPAPAATAPAGWAPPSFRVPSPRKLQLELEMYIDRQLLKSHAGELYAAIQKNDGNTIVGLANKALAELKVREKTNNNDGPMVELIQKTCGGIRGYAWCMYQQQSCVAYAEKKLNLLSKLPASGGCADVRARVGKDMIVPLADLQQGDIWIWVHANGSGHTGCFISWIVPMKAANMVEGNTTSGHLGDAIVREGGGSYETERAVTYTGSMALKMCIRPFPKVS